CPTIRIAAGPRERREQKRRVHDHRHHEEYAERERAEPLPHGWCLSAFGENRPRRRREIVEDLDAARAERARGCSALACAHEHRARSNGIGGADVADSVADERDTVERDAEIALETAE